MVTPAPSSRRFLAPGDKLGKYEVIRQIAVGGMAELYLTRTVGIEGFEKLVCVKRILPQYINNPSFVNMFLNEARLAATLHHPNIAQVYDIGQDAGEYFFSMEYVHGEDLGRLVAAGRENGVPISLDCALTLAAGLCAGLHHAHEKASPDGRPLGVVHRDVSPTNVLVSYDGAVKLVDFGIARAGGEPSQSTTGLKGKISYMSPEQCRGRTVLDRRSDVFSVGTILYELTTGRLPFVDETEYGVLHQIVNRDAEPPSTVVPGFPPALEAIVMRALAREPERRFSTALELQNQLEDYAHENRLRVSPLVLARLMSTLFPARLEEWDHARAQGAFFVEQHVVRTLIESGKTADSSPRYMPTPLPQADDASDGITSVASPPTATDIQSMAPMPVGPTPRMSVSRPSSWPTPASEGASPRASSPPLASGGALPRASSPPLASGGPSPRASSPPLASGGGSSPRPQGASLHAAPPSRLSSASLPGMGSSHAGPPSRLSSPSLPGMGSSHAGPPSRLSSRLSSPSLPGMGPSSPSLPGVGASSSSLPGVGPPSRLSSSSLPGVGPSLPGVGPSLPGVGPSSAGAGPAAAQLAPPPPRSSQPVATQPLATPTPQSQQMAAHQPLPTPLPSQQMAAHQPLPTPLPSQQMAAHQPLATPTPQSMAAHQPLPTPPPSSQQMAAHQPLPTQQMAAYQPQPTPQPSQQMAAHQPQPSQQMAAHQPLPTPLPTQQMAAHQPLPTPQPSQPGGGPSSGRSSQGRGSLIPNMPGAVPIVMPLPAPPIPSGGTLVSSATQAGNPPPAVKPVVGPYGSTGLGGLAGQSVQGYTNPGGPAGFAGHSIPMGYGGAGEPDGMAQGGFGPVSIGDVTDRVRISGARASQMPHHKRRFPLLALVIVGAAGALVGVWLAVGRDGDSMAPASADPPGMPSRGEASKPPADRAAGPDKPDPAGIGKAAEPPADPAGTGKAAEPPADPAAPAKPADSAKSADSAEPPAMTAEPAKPGDSARPGSSARPRDSAKPAKSADSAKPADSAKSADSAKPAAPALAADPVRADQPGKVAAPPDRRVEPPSSTDKPADLTEDPTKSKSSKVAQDPHPKTAKPRVRAEPKRVDKRGRKPEPKEQTWSADSPFLPETTPKR